MQRDHLHSNISYVTTILRIFVLSCSFSLPLLAEGIRISTRSIHIHNDSLFIDLNMNLEDVHAASGVSFTFTPCLCYQGQLMELPPVVVTGARRARFDIREKALSGRKGEAKPYRILTENKKTNKNIRYNIGIPFTSWMQYAALALKQESKDCCVEQLLSTDTLTRNIGLHQPTQPRRYFAAAKPDSNRYQAAAIMPVMTSAPITPQAVAPALTMPVTATPMAVTTAVPCLPVVTPCMPLSPVALAGYLPMVSYLTPDKRELVKERTASAVLYIDYPVNVYEVYLDYKNNRREVDKADSILTPVLSNGFTIISQIRIRGYASPDGNYQDNEKLASRRSRLFMHYISDAYSIPEKLFDVSWVAEDWDGTIDLLQRIQPPYYQESLNIIHRWGVFSGREKQLMDLRGGEPYKYMLHNLFPLLRRIELVVQYNIRNIDRTEAADLIYTHPELLSLEEMYDVARYYRPGTEQYREIYEIAAYHYPNDVVANVNAASAVMLTGDLISAWEYLRKVEDSPKAWNNMGVLTLMEGNPEGAITWFRKAVGIEPQKARANLQMVERMVAAKQQGLVR